MEYQLKTQEEVVVKKDVVTNVTLPQYVGYKLSEAREAAELNSKEVVETTGLSITHIRNIEKGLPTLKLKDIEILCQLYAVTVTSLFPPEEVL